MIQGDFSAMVSAKTEGFSGGQFCLGVEALHDAAGKLSLGTKPVEQEGLVTTQHPGDPFHGFDL